MPTAARTAAPMLPPSICGGAGAARPPRGRRWGTARGGRTAVPSRAVGDVLRAAAQSAPQVLDVVVALLTRKTPQHAHDMAGCLGLGGAGDQPFGGGRKDTRLQEPRQLGTVGDVPRFHARGRATGDLLVRCQALARLLSHCVILTCIIGVTHWFPRSPDARSSSG